MTKVDEITKKYGGQIGDKNLIIKGVGGRNEKSPHRKISARAFF